MAETTLHVVSHTHWDREWYMPFELHRRRLVRLLDDVLDVIDRDPGFASFHLDGQTIPIDDYLAVRPDQAERFRAAAAAGRITVGPWYILQDEFLTSAEAQTRNLLYGLRDAAKWGEPLRVGYLADAFGHIGQMPALLAGFGIGNAVFGRGLGRQLPAQAGEDPGDDATDLRSELVWRGADGTEILVVYMANWYCNAADIPAEPEAAIERFAKIKAGCERFATTPHLLLMNGCDHTLCQFNISELIALANERLGDKVVHSRLDDYVAAVAASLDRDAVPRVFGELRSEHTPGWGTLTNVLSARLYLKQANHRCQTLLEKVVEPLGAVAALLGDDRCGASDRDFRRYLWQLLLQNHPHDSICGCSVDAVHCEMETRFAKVEQLAEQVAGEALEAVAQRIDTSGLADGEAALVVHNPLAFARREPVEAIVDFPAETSLTGVKVRDADGREVPVELVRDHGLAWDYELPDDRFRVSYERRRVDIRFAAEVPAFGYAVYTAAPTRAEAPAPEPGAAVLENEHLRADVRPGGELDLLDKATGRCYRGLNALHLGRDIGDEYKHIAPDADIDVTPTAAEGDGPRVTATALAQVCEGRARMVVPATAPGAEGEEQRIDIDYTLRLAAGGRRIEVALAMDNVNARNYRLRAHFPTGAGGVDHVSADGHFEVVRRRVEPWEGWENPSNCQPCLDFVDRGDDAGGLTLAPRGLPEYEALRDGEGTLALTVLRGVDRLGDWGDFPTPDAQCRRRNVAEYAVIPRAGALETSGADLEARAYNAPLRTHTTGRHAGELPRRASWLALEPASLVLSAVRRAEDRDAFIVRFYNPYDQPVAATLRCGLPLREAWRCNLDEQRGERLGELAGGLALEVGPKAIVTLELA